MFRRVAIAWLLAAGCLLPLTAQTKTLRIAAAADLQPVLPTFVAEFSAKTGIHAEVSYASSATLATQILNGAPYDLFFAANMAFPQKVVDAGLAIESAPVPYARGTLVLWARRDALREPLSMEILRTPAVRRIAIANPVHAPYGAAAMSALQSLGLAGVLQPKLVFAENIAQTAEFAHSGNADCAFISKTIALTPSMRQTGGFIAVPANAYPPIVQGVVILRRAAHPQAAKDFLAGMQSDAGRKQLAAAGLEPPRKSAEAK